MKKVVSIFAVVLMSVGMFSCTTDNKDEALYDVETLACDNCSNETDDRGKN